MNQSNLTKTLYPSDSKGVVCLQDAVDSNNTKYPFLYFNDISNPNSNRYIITNQDIVFRNVLNREFQLAVMIVVQSSTIQIIHRMIDLEPYVYQMIRIPSKICCIMLEYFSNSMQLRPSIIC